MKHQERQDHYDDEAINQAPEYSDALTLTRDYEEGLHGHYNRPGYWSEEPASGKRVSTPPTPDLLHKVGD